MLGSSLFLLGGLVASAARIRDTTLLPDLPLVEARAASGGRTLAVLWSGDGNWAPFVRGLTRDLNAQGVSVLGLKARAYLSGPVRKTPEQAARDLERILDRYQRAWSADTVVVIGYSRGANLLPFALTRLSDRRRATLGLVVLLSPAVNTSFEFHLVDLISDQHRPTDLELLPEVRKLRGLPILCVYGTEDRNALCPVADPGLMAVEARRHGHGMGEADGIAPLVLKALRDRFPAHPGSAASAGASE